MSEAPRYRDGHAVIAAVRVHEARESRPPTSAEIAQLLGWHPDRASVLTRALTELGILKPLTSPYDIRFEVRDHLALEKLPDDDPGAGFAEELSAFAQEKEREQERLASFFETGESEKARQKRVDNLDDEFRQFRRGKKPSPFGD